jgi:hypothetical protein
VVLGVIVIAAGVLLVMLLVSLTHVCAPLSLLVLRIHDEN